MKATGTKPRRSVMGPRVRHSTERARGWNDESSCAYSSQVARLPGGWSGAAGVDPVHRNFLIDHVLENEVMP
jgi:hypothetical protein